MIKVCSKCGNQVSQESIYCPKCGTKIQEENIDSNENQVKTEKNKLNKKQLAFIVIAGIVIVSLVCIILFGEKHYRCVSEKVYAYNEELYGPSEPSEISLDLSSSFIKNNTKIRLNYFNNEYTAKYYDGFVFWDKEPKILDGGTEAFTTITKKGNVVNLVITESYLIDGKPYYIELRMKFER